MFASAIPAYLILCYYLTETKGLKWCRNEQKSKHIDYFPNRHILQSGQSNWPYLWCLWDLQVLFYNLFTCTEGHSNPIIGMFGIAPPTVAEYLYSANNNLLIPLITAEHEVDNFGLEPDRNCLYYHLP
jgi:hypothetical protein